MLADRKAPKGDYRSLLLAIGGDLPNRYGHFNLAWKKAHGHAVKLSRDWFEDLLSVPRSKISPVLGKVYRDCVLQTALLRAAGTIGQQPALTESVVDALVDAAYIHQGTFRDEVGRAIQAVGNEAIPYLVLRSTRLPRTRNQEDPRVLKAHYARVQLDRMDRLHPARATEAVRDDPRLLASVLATYGEAKVGEAADVLLRFVDDRSPAVREAAVKAFSAYVTGPPPKVRSREVRLLGGGTGRAQAYLSYRQRALRAIRAKVFDDAPVLLEAPCEVRRENGSIDKKCLGQPQRLTRSYFAWLELRREIGERAEVDGALAAEDPNDATRRLDRLLAVNPQLGHADKLVPFYERQARRALDEGEPRRAAGLMRKASMLVGAADPSKSRALRVQALLAEARAPSLPDRGREMLLATADELAPGEPEIAAALARVRTERVDDTLSRDRIKVLGALAMLAAALTVLMALGAPIRRLVR